MTPTHKAWRAVKKWLREEQAHCRKLAAQDGNLFGRADYSARANAFAGVLLVMDAEMRIAKKRK